MMMRLVAVAGNSCLTIRSLIVLNKASLPIAQKDHPLCFTLALVKGSINGEIDRGGENGVGNCATQVRNSMVSNSNTLCICSLTGTGILGETWRLHQ